LLRSQNVVFAIETGRKQTAPGANYDKIDHAITFVHVRVLCYLNGNNEKNVQIEHGQDI
jgi:hypothetical protein